MRSVEDERDVHQLVTGAHALVTVAKLSILINCELRRRWRRILLLLSYAREHTALEFCWIIQTERLRCRWPLLLLISF